MIKMGPILSFRGVSEDGLSWNLSALVVAEGAPGELRIEAAGGAAAACAELWKVGNLSAWRYQFTAPLSADASKFRYTIGDRGFEVALPARGMPPRLAYTSCNGFSSLKAMKGVDDKNALWKRLADQHRTDPYHLLMMGGDQVYADSMWETVRVMRDWAALSSDAGNRAKATAQMIREVERFYFDLYTSRWAQPEVAALLATIPTMMMWDDHDIIDGWGSYPEARQMSEVYQKAIWPAAQRAFRAFQQQLMPGEVAGAGIAAAYGFTFGHVIGGIAVLAIDMRSERRLHQVLSAAHWEAIYRWLDSLPEVEHLLIMSSIPVVYPGFDTLERILGLWPGQDELEDDLADHWNSRSHKAERLRLIHRILRLTEEETVRPTLISGDVHVAALGYVESSRGGAGRGAVVNQLISSGIVHPGPPGAVVFALRHLFDNTDEIDRGIVGRMADFPGTQVRFIGKRNYMTIEPDPKRSDFRLWVNWWVEGEAERYTKVIHPLQRKAATIVAPQPPASKAG